MTLPTRRFGQRRRATAPLGVQACALLMYLAALGSALAAAALWASGHGAAGTADGLPPELIRSGTGAAVGLGVAAVCWLVVARSVQAGLQWARVLVLVLCALSLAATGWRLYAAGVTAGTCVAVAFAAAPLVLLNTGSARSWFRHHAY